MHASPPTVSRLTADQLSTTCSVCSAESLWNWMTSVQSSLAASTAITQSALSKKRKKSCDSMFVKAAVSFWFRRFDRCCLFLQDREFFNFSSRVMSNCVFLCLQTMTDVVGNPEEERRAEFYYQPWAQEAVCRYFYSKVTQFSSTSSNSYNSCIVSAIFLATCCQFWPTLDWLNNCLMNCHNNLVQAITFPRG